MFNSNDDLQNNKLSKIILDLLDRMDETEDKTTKDFGGDLDNLVKLVKLKNETIKTEEDTHHEEQKLDLDALKINSENEKIRIEAEKLLFEQEKFDFEKEKFASWRPSTDAIVGAAATLLGIVAVLHYEKVGIVTSKALSFVGRGMR